MCNNLECAVFFRSRGFRARVVDFVADDTIEDAMEILTAHISTSSSSNAAKDSNDDTESSLLAPYKRVMLSPQNASGKKARTSKTATHAKSPLASVVRRLTRWIYKYFTANTNSNAARTHTDSHTHTHAFRTPLYLQYHGHSVSVVGIVECGDGVDDYCLVTFDPYDSTQSILRTLYETLVQIDNHSQTHTYTYSHPEGKGEDDMMHTHSPPHLVDLSTHIIKPVRKFKGKDYQVVYVESGLMGEVEMRMSRVMDSVRA
ncbi:hypothetical protein EON65_22090 [archaeon]|nr:MAG: hypothetical protein EON65_22090 [archaeon]